MNSDHDDIRRLLAANDPTALDLIHERFCRLLHGYVLSILGSSHDAEDVMQELFVSVSTQRARIASAANLPGYLVGMARNQALQCLRRRPRREHPLGDAVEILVAAPGRAIDADRTRALTAALMTLPLEQREVIALKIDDGRTFAEIAELLEVSINTVASRYRYAVEKLRAQLGSTISTIGGGSDG